MSITMNSFRHVLLCVGIFFLGWYSSHLVPVDSELNYMDLKATRLINEETIQLLGTCADVQFDVTDRLQTLNDEITGRARSTSRRSLREDTGIPPTLPNTAWEIHRSINCLGMGLVHQRETLNFLLNHVREKKHLTEE